MTNIEYNRALVDRSRTSKGKTRATKICFIFQYIKIPVQKAETLLLHYYILFWIIPYLSTSVLQESFLRWHYSSFTKSNAFYNPFQYGCQRLCKCSNSFRFYTGFQLRTPSASLYTEHIAAVQGSLPALSATVTRLNCPDKHRLCFAITSSFPNYCKPVVSTNKDQDVK